VVKAFHRSSDAASVAAENKIHPTLVRKWAKISAILSAVKDQETAEKPAGKLKVNGKGDVLIYLRHMQDAIKTQVKRDPSRISDPAYLLGMLALNKLEGRE
jgi:hypothetical protein